jgi:Cof subfamily protein (haloacid dehalogenase superfamily)
MIKLIAFDLDKTILTNRHAISATDTATIRKLYDRGIIIVPASGRMTPSIRLCVRQIKRDMPIISYNGALARDTIKRKERILYHNPLPSHYSDRIIAFAEENRICLNYYLNDVLYSKQSPALRKYSTIYTRQTKSPYTFLPDLLSLLGKQPTKLLIVTEPEVRDMLYKKLHKKFGDKINVVKTNPEYLEFMNKKADKGKGLKAIARAYAIRRNEIIAFGDADNDIGMLRYAGTGIAVLNANSRVKKAADYILPVTNNQDPLTTACRELKIEL